VDVGLLAQLRWRLAVMSEVATAKAVQTMGWLTTLGNMVIRGETPPFKKKRGETPKTLAPERLLILRCGHSGH
jgi:hypothetical protein